MRVRDNDLLKVESDTVEMYRRILHDYKGGVYTLSKAIKKMDEWKNIHSGMISGMFLYDFIDLSTYDKWSDRAYDTYKKFYNMLF